MTGWWEQMHGPAGWQGQQRLTGGGRLAAWFGSRLPQDRHVTAAQLPACLLGWPSLRPPLSPNRHPPRSAVWLTSLLDVAMLRSTFVTSLARFTMLHSPASMRLKHARAFR